MVRRGWPHGELMAMSEGEFGFWLRHQIEFDHAEAEARRKAIERAGKG